MASKTIIMYAKKKYELGDFKDAIKSEFYIMRRIWICTRGGNTGNVDFWKMS